MSRSPLAYPLTRGIDGDSGGAADLQTDIMRFMAILALCLVAIFALVQSLPMAPEAPVAESTPAPEPVAKVVPVPAELPVAEPPAEPPPVAVARPTENQQVSLTRPPWTPKYAPAPRTDASTAPAAALESSPVEASPSAATAPSETAPPAQPAEQNGFTLRFESDLTLTRLVASGQVGFYAIEPGRAQRMAVQNSRISFWEASTPNEFHEMESATVPQPVVDALSRSGADASTVSFGVTLPSRLRGQLSHLMSSHRGGALVIRANGNLQLEPGG